MPLRPRLNTLKKQVAKLIASAPRKGQGAFWLAIWRLDDLTKLVAEAIPWENYGYDVTCVHAVAMAFIARKEAALAGMADAPELVAALKGLDDAIDRCLNPPRGTDWKGREVLKQAVIMSTGPVSEFVFQAVWRVSDDHGYPPDGRPPRLTELPAAWFPAEPSGDAGELVETAPTNLPIDLKGLDDALPPGFEKQKGEGAGG